MGIVGLMKTGAAGDHSVQERRARRDAAGRPRLGAMRRASAARSTPKSFLNKMWGLPPALDMDYEKRVQAAIREIVNAGLAESAHDLSDGGLAVALAEMLQRAASARPIEARHRASAPNSRCSTKVPRASWFRPPRPKRWRRSRASTASNALRIGVTMKERLRIDHHSVTWIDCPVDRLREVWENALEDLLAPAHA